MAVALLVLVIGFAAGTVSHLWNEFKLWQPAQQSNQYFRLLSLAGSHRYQYWQVAWNAFESSPFHGIGPGTFQYYWFQHTTHAEYILNAHSLWFETLAETGIVGWLLLVGFFAVILVGGASARLRRPTAPRTLIAATHGRRGRLLCRGVVRLGLADRGRADGHAAARQCGTRDRGHAAAQPVDSMPPSPRASWARSRLLRPRLLVALGGMLALVLIAIPLASTIAVRNSQAAAAKGDLRQALTDARTAQAIEPGAASPYLQQALVLEKGNDIKARRRNRRRDRPRAPQLQPLADRLANRHRVRSAAPSRRRLPAGPRALSHLDSVPARMIVRCRRAYHWVMRIHRIVPALVAIAFLASRQPRSPASRRLTRRPARPAAASTPRSFRRLAATWPRRRQEAATPTAAQISALGSGKTGLQKVGKLGKAGAAAAVFAEATAPVASTHGLGSTVSGSATPGSTGTHHVAALASSSGGSGLSAIGHVLDGSDAGGIGVFLPLLLAFGLGAAVTVSVQRARRARQPPA